MPYLSPRLSFLLPLSCLAALSISSPDAQASILVGNPVGITLPGEVALLVFTDTPTGTATLRSCDPNPSTAVVSIAAGLDEPARFIVPEGEWCSATLEWDDILVIDGKSFNNWWVWLRLDVPETIASFETPIDAGPDGVAIDVIYLTGGSPVLSSSLTHNIWVDTNHDKHDDFAARFEQGQAD